MKNELVRKVEKVEVRRITPIPRFVKAFAIKPYLSHLRKPQPHYNSRNSNINYSA